MPKSALDPIDPKTPEDKADATVKEPKASDDKKADKPKDDEKGEEKLDEEKTSDAGPSDSSGALQAHKHDRTPVHVKDSFTTTIADEARAKKAEDEKGHAEPQWIGEGAQKEDDKASK